MAKYVKCTNNIDVENYIEVGKEYKLLEVAVDGSYLIESGHGTYWFLPSRFDSDKINSEGEPITFTSQEDFENAVMEVVLKRLGVYNYTESPTGGGSKDYIYTEDLA